MARVKRAVGSKKHRRQVLEKAKGYYGNKSRSYRAAHEQVMQSGQYAFRDRRARKGEFRKLWIQRINAACRLHDMSYSQFIAGLHAAGIEVDRKILADLAVTDDAAFGALVGRRDAKALGAAQRPPEPRLAFTNPKIQRLRRLLGRRSARQEEGAFVIEGAALLAEALDGRRADRGGVRRARARCPSTAVAPRSTSWRPGVVERVASTVSPQPVLAVVARTDVPWRAVAPTLGFVVVAAGLGDPGQHGHHPALGRGRRRRRRWWSPRDRSTSSTRRWCGPRPARCSTCPSWSTCRSPRWASSACRCSARWPPAACPTTRRRSSARAPSCSATRPTGCPAGSTSTASCRIPHAGRAESLNVAMAATVLCFEAARRRR